MILSIEEVERIARLARLELTAEEIALYQGQLSAVLDYAQKLNELDIENVPPTSSAVALKNVLREDAIQPSLPTEEALFNADQQSENQFLIQAVLDETG